MTRILAVIDSALTLYKANFHVVQFLSGSTNNAGMGRRLVYLFHVCSPLPVGDSLQRSVNEYNRQTFKLRAALTVKQSLKPAVSISCPGHTNAVAG